MKLAKMIFLVLFTLCIGFSFVACSNPAEDGSPHEHAFGDWQSNSDEHWRVCNSDETEERSSHVDKNSDELCDECGYDLSEGDDANDDNNTDDGGDQNTEIKIPQVLINEVRTEYLNSNVEFIELKIVGDGNLSALQVFSAGESIDEPIYQFPSAEVKTGEYVVLFLRTLDSASVNETGDNLPLPSGKEDSSTTREFRVAGTTKLTRKTDILFIKDKDGKIVDALMMSENPDAEWKNDKLLAAADLLGINGAWLANGEASDSPEPLYAVPTQYTTQTRTVCRDESAADSNSASDWYITADRGATPGAANDTDRYEVKEE